MSCNIFLGLHVTNCILLYTNVNVLSQEDRYRHLMAAAESAAGLYEHGGKLADLDIIEDVEEYE